jgi:hypothetical protein
VQCSSITKSPECSDLGRVGSRGISGILRILIPTYPPADNSLQNFDTYPPPSIPYPRSTKIPESPTKLRVFIENHCSSWIPPTHLPPRHTCSSWIPPTYLPPRICRGLLPYPWRKYATQVGATSTPLYTASKLATDPYSRLSSGPRNRFWYKISNDMVQNGAHGAKIFTDGTRSFFTNVSP